MSAAAIGRARASGLVWLLAVALVSTVQAPVAGALEPGQRQQTSTQPSERERHGAQQLGAREERARRACLKELGGVIDDSDAKLRAALRDTCRQSALADVPIDDKKGIPLELVLLGACAVGLAICANRLWRRF